MSKHRAPTPRDLRAARGRHRGPRSSRRLPAPHAVAAGVGTLGATGAATVALLAALPGEVREPERVRSDGSSSSVATGALLWPALEPGAGPVLARPAAVFPSTPVGASGQDAATVGQPSATATATAAPTEAPSTPTSPGPTPPAVVPGGPSRGPDVPLSTASPADDLLEVVEEALPVEVTVPVGGGPASAAVGPLR